MLELLVKTVVREGNINGETNELKTLKSLAEIDFSKIAIYDLGSRDEKNNKINITHKDGSSPNNYVPTAVGCDCYVCHGCDTTCACICQQCQCESG